MLTNKKLTFATANLYNFIEPPGAFYDFENIYTAQEWENKCRWTIESIKALDADIIAVQEVFSIDSIRDILFKLGFNHFVSVDEAHVESEYIYSHPVVALASKYPITQYHAVTVPLSLLEGYGIRDLAFSRQPVCAVIDVPSIGEVAVYVCHLKSQRETQAKPDAKTHAILGQWLSGQQRGWEALMIRIAMEQAYSKKPMPTVLMGDLNQSISSEMVGLLTKPIEHESDHLILQDSWDIINPDLSSAARPATHYHFSTGKVLDYILLSQEFHTSSHCSMADLIQYRTLDSHLISPCFEKDNQASDHAFVSVTAPFVL